LKALACLPRTLDETYARIFLEIPDEARLAVHHALKWVYAHNELHKNNIPSPNLIQAVQRSISGFDSRIYEYDYNIDLLRELCGCLISVSPQDRWGAFAEFSLTAAVAFAHYTVLEFLDSARIQTGPASFFAVDKETVKLEFAKMVMLEALDCKPRSLLANKKTLKDIHSSKEEIADAMEESFNLYGIVSSILAVRNWGRAISTDKTTCNIAFALFDVTKEHFEVLETALRCIENDAGVFSTGHDLFNFEQFWRLSWKQRPTNEVVRTLINLIYTDQSTQLARKFVQNIRPGDWMSSKFVLELEMWDLTSNDDVDWYLFEGTITELFALLSKGWPAALRLLLEFATGYFNPSKILLLSIGWHGHDEWDGYSDYCIPGRLLQLGAHPDGCGHRICPLQIAARTLDLDGVQLLLEAGANPNNTGDEKGEMWKEGTIPALFNEVVNRSPLNIVETMDCFFSDFRDDKREALPKIVELLRKYGARNFVGTEAEPLVQVGEC
jgi:hypothetical protein